MKKFLVVTNEFKDERLVITERLQKHIEKRGGQCETLLYHPNGLNRLEFDRDADCILVLGGDGTLLMVAREASIQGIPILGINLGTLGFLAEVEVPKMEEAIDRLFRDDFSCEDRLMLDGKIERQGNETVQISPALNDITITRCGTLQIIRYRIFVNHKFLCRLSADGVILSTPTGSTGYNMSAGGPIADPDARMILLTPICAHSFNAKSIIFSSDNVIEVEIDEGCDGNPIEVEVSADGNEKYKFRTGDRLIVSTANTTAKIIKLNQTSFLEALHRKMSEC